MTIETNDPVIESLFNDIDNNTDPEDCLDKGFVFDEVGFFANSLIEEHELCHSCTMDALLSYYIMDMRARGKHLEGIIDLVNEEFVNWDAAIRETEEAA